MHWDVCKIFISSTFLDLELERDRVLQVFIDYQKELFSERISLVPYDLRWQNPIADKSIARWCISKVKDCQYFVGIIANRYGWCPEYDANETLNHQKISITHMEINTALEFIPRQNRFFFVYENLSQEQPQHNILLSLQNHNEDIYFYNSTEDITTKLANEIRKRIKRGENKTPINKIDSNIFGRHREIIECQKFVEKSPQQYLILDGVSGIGKTTILQKFISTFEFPTITYFTTSGNTPQKLHEHLVDEFTDKWQTKFLNHAAQIPTFLSHTREKILIVLDGVLDASFLTWLPKTLSTTVKIIISCRDHRNLNIEKKQVLTVGPLKIEDSKEIIKEYEKNFCFELSQTEKKQLHEQAKGHPLYLKVAIEEILNGGTSIGQLATTIDELFHQTLSRLTKKRSAVEDYLGIIAVSDLGIKESEIHEILRKNHLPEEILYVESLLCNFITTRNGNCYFFHPQFAQVVKQRLGSEKLCFYHASLAKYFLQKEYNLHSPLCYHLQKSKNYTVLLHYLCSAEFWISKANNGLLENLLRDLNRALEDVDKIPKDKSYIISKIQVSYAEIYLLRAALFQDITFLSHYPEYLVQTIVNRCSHHQGKSNIREIMHKWRNQNLSPPWIEAQNEMFPSLHSSTIKILQGHHGDIYGLNISWDGQLLVSSADNVIKVWDIHSNRLLQTFVESCRVYDVAFSYDQKSILACNSYGEVNVWSIKKAKIIHQQKAHRGELYALAVYEKWVASGGEDGKICLWQMPNLKRKGTLTLHNKTISAVALRKKYLISGGKSTVGIVWDTDKKCILYKWPHDGAIRSITIDEKCQLVAVGTYSKTIYLWNLQNGKLISKLQGHKDYVTAVVFSKDSQHLFSASGDKTVRMWDLKDYTSQKTFRGHSGHIWSCQVSTDNRFLITGSYDETIRIWDIHKKDAYTNKCNHRGRIYAKLHNKEQNVLITASRDCTVKTWCLDSFTNTKTQKFSSPVLCVSLHPKGYLTCGTVSGHVSIVHSKYTKTIKEHASICAINYNKTGEYIALGCRDGQIIVRDTQKYKMQSKLNNHHNKIIALVFHQKCLYASYQDNTVIQWDFHTGKRLKMWQNISIDHFLRTPCHSLLGINDDNLYMWKQGPHIISSKQYSQMLKQKFYVKYNTNETLVYNMNDRQISVLPVGNGQIVGGNTVITTNVSGHLYMFKIHNKKATLRYL